MLDPNDIQAGIISNEGVNIFFTGSISNFRFLSNKKAFRKYGTLFYYQPYDFDQNKPPFLKALTPSPILNPLWNTSIL